MSRRFASQTMAQYLLHLRNQLKAEIFLPAVEVVKPQNLFNSQISFKEKDRILEICDKERVSFNDYENVDVIGFGKAVLPMAEKFLQIVDNQVKRCVLSIPDGFRESENTKIEVYRGAKNNQPDLSALQGANNIMDVVKKSGPDDLLIVLITGGGSALLPAPKPPLTLEKKAAIIRHLAKGGASIHEMNSVRKKLSLVKGGGLVRMCRAKKIISFILSDVINDDLDTIASGTTVPNTDSDDHVRSIVEKYIPQNMFRDIFPVMARGNQKDPSNFHEYEKVSNYIIGNNSRALKEAAAKAQRLNLLPVIVTSKMQGEAREIGHCVAALTKLSLRFLYGNSNVSSLDTKQHMEKCLKILFAEECLEKDIWKSLLEAKNDESCEGIAILIGGESTVTVKGEGVGGRNQEAALSCAISLDEDEDCDNKAVILFGGSDGIDGTCDAAGAVIDSSTVGAGKLSGLDAESYLKNNDSYNYFKSLQSKHSHLITGHTGTNVMDLIIAVLLKKPKALHGVV